MFPGAWGLALVAIVVTSAAAGAQSRSVDAVDDRPLRTSNRTLQASLERIAAGSVLWREAVDALRASGRHALIVTTEQLASGEGSSAPPHGLDATLLAEAMPIAGPDARVHAVLVVVNLALLEDSYRSRPLLPVDLDRDLDRVLVHEVYGHALPYLLAGDLTGRCADPRPGQRAVEACSIQRENAVRAELGLGRRTEYGLAGLALARRGVR